MSLQESVVILIESELQNRKRQWLLELSWELRDIVEDKQAMREWYQQLLNKLSDEKIE